MATSTLPVFFRKSGEGAIASFDFYDMFTQTGYKSLYGINLIAGSSAAYALTTELIPSYNTYTEALNAAMDLDFDLAINQPVTLKGDAIIMMPVYANVASAAVTCTIKLYHVDAAAAETQLGSTVTQAYTFPGAGYKWKAITGKITVAEKRFLHGEKIRISVTTSAGGANVTVYIGHDPSNLFYLDTAIYSNRFQALLPFKIDL